MNVKGASRFCTRLYKIKVKLIAQQQKKRKESEILLQSPNAWLFSVFEFSSKWDKLIDIKTWRNPKKRISFYHQKYI